MSEALRVADRCDKGDCGAQAYVRVEFPHIGLEGSHLDFCGHHFRRYELDLMAIEGTIVLDERAKLDEKIVSGTPVN